MTTSHYGTTGLLKNSQGQIVSQKVKFKVVLVYLALVLDNILLTVVVPIIPIFLYQNEALERNLTLQNSKGILDEFIEDEFIAEKSAKTEGLMVSENSRIGALFASKAFVQLIFNPLVGKATITFGYDIPFLIGTSFLLLSSLIFTFVTSFHWLFAARSLQGIASSSIAVSGMGMVANLFEEDTERSKAMGLVLGGIASGVLIGYPLGGILFDFVGETSPFIMMDIAITLVFLMELKFMWPSRLYLKDEEDTESTPSGFLHLFKDINVLIVSGAILVSTTAMALLEPCLPIWLMDTIHPQKWQIGTVFLPDSVGYLIGTNFFAVPALKYGRYKVAMVALFLVGLGCFLIPLASSMWDLVLPHGFLGLGIGVVDSSLMPLLAVLVDEENDLKGTGSSAYGSVYAIAQTAVSLAYGLGPLLGGRLSQTYNFPDVMRALGCLNWAYIPVVFLLKRNRQQLENPEVIQHVELKTMQNS